MTSPVLEATLGYIQRLAKCDNRAPQRELNKDTAVVNNLGLRDVSSVTPSKALNACNLFKIWEINFTLTLSTLVLFCE